MTGVEEKLQAAEAALQGTEPDDKTRDLIGHIAAIRATLAVTQHEVETIIAQSRRALEYLHPDNLPVRTATTWTLGYAYQLQGDRAAASQAYTEAIRYQPGDRGYLHHHSGDHRPGQRTGSRQPARIWRPRPTGASCNWQVIRRCRLPAKRILAWPVSSTNGTTWMPPSSTGNRASSWRGR